jgi:catechol 2,3-dioxygenase-like lactoylglutathione lyase family enzyme
VSGDPTETTDAVKAPDPASTPEVAEAPAPAPEQKQLKLGGIHHVTAICADLERTVSFYRDLLGLTLIKRTTNEDDPGARHFYFGDSEATPGSIVTFMEYPNMDQGAIGVGVVHHFALRAGSLDELNAWHKHLNEHGVQATEPINRTYYSSIYFRDPDGNILEIATDGPGIVVE